MKILFGLCLSILLISCGERNASEIYGSGDFSYQKPDDDVWTSISDAAVLDDRYVRLSIERNDYEGGDYSVDVIVDEQNSSVKSFINDKEVNFVTFECRQSLDSSCVSYVLKSIYGARYEIERRTNVVITTQTGSNTTTSSYRAISIRHLESAGEWDYISIEKPIDSRLYWPVGAIRLPDTQIFQSMRGVALPGSLTQDSALYDFEGMAYAYYADRTELKGTFRHMLTNQKEEVLWVLRSEH